jgi:hypothetical protein
MVMGIHVTGRYREGKVELDQPLDLPDGTRVEVDVLPAADDVREAWAELGMERLEAEWDNPGDAIYDDWKKLYGVGESVL